MKLKRLKLKNIRSYEDKEIEFPAEAVLLSGDIGSGKTSILLAIEYALFGLQPGQKGSALLRNNTHIGEVLLEFEVDGQNIIIERRLKREAKSISNDYSAITVNGDKTEGSVTELKTKILTLLNYPSEFIKKNNILYRYTVYTPQEQMKQIILEDSEIRLNILGHVFGIDKYKRIRENLAIILNRIKEDSKILQGEIKTLEQDKVQLESTKRFVILVEDKIRKNDAEKLILGEKRKTIEIEIKELESKVKEKDIFEKEVEKTGILIASKREQLYLAERELNSLMKSLSESSEYFSEEKLKEVVAKIIKEKEEVEKLNLKFIELAGKSSSLEQAKKTQLEKKDRVFKMEFCPTCLQNVPYAHKHNILNEVERELVSITANLKVIGEEKVNVSAELAKKKSLLPSFEQEKTKFEILRSKMEYIERSRKKIDEIRKEKESFERDITFLSTHLESLKENISRFSKFSNLLRAKQNELELAVYNEKKSEISIAESKKELELTIKEISNLQKTIDAKEDAKKRLIEFIELSAWLSNQFTNLINVIERNVMIKLRMEFSKLFGKWFSMLAGDSFEVHLDENFTPLILQGEIEMDYAFLSGGERTAIALAYRLALNQTINSVLSNIKTKDLIILDEPTDGFSEQQLVKLREVLEELKIGQLIIVSHEQKIEGFVDNVIKLRKDGDVSTIEKAPM